jgi:hypothetical protein
MDCRSRQVIARIDRFCAQLNDGLVAVAIVLTIITSLTVAFRTAHTLRVPDHFEIAATT